VPAVPVQDAPRHRLLPYSGVRSVDPDRDPVVGVVLDQRGRQSGARLNRAADRLDHDHHEQRRPSIPTSRLIHQGCSLFRRCASAFNRCYNYTIKHNVQLASQCRLPDTFIMINPPHVENFYWIQILLLPLCKIIAHP